MAHNIEPKPELPYNAQEYYIALECLSTVQDLVSDEDIDCERPDLWTATWEELQVENPTDPAGQANQQIAKAEIYTLYKEGLCELYPHLREVESSEEMIIEMARIQDLPECNGMFILSEYTADDGTYRALSYAEVDLGNGKNMSLARIIDDDDGILKSYAIGVGIAYNLWGGVCVNMSRDETEKQMVHKVHPSQANNLVRVINGAIEPYELDMMLTEIQVMSQDVVDGVELCAIIEYARAQYYVALEKYISESEAGLMVLSFDDLHDIRRILDLRYLQLKNL